MCCGVPEDMYDLLILVTQERDIGDAFAAAFEAREGQERVALVVPSSEAFRARTARLRRALERSDVSIIEGCAEPDADGDPHYLTVDGRLLRADRMLRLAAV